MCFILLKIPSSKSPNLLITSTVICGVPALGYLIRYISGRFWTTNKFLAEQAKQEKADFAKAVLPLEQRVGRMHATLDQAQLHLTSHEQKMDIANNALQAAAHDSAQNAKSATSLYANAQSGKTYITSLLSDIGKLNPTLHTLTQDQSANTQLIRDIETYDTKIDEHLQNSAELVDAMRLAVAANPQPGTYVASLAQNYASRS